MACVPSRTGDKLTNAVNISFTIGPRPIKTRLGIIADDNTAFRVCVHVVAVCVRNWCQSRDKMRLMFLRDRKSVV